VLVALLAVAQAALLATAIAGAFTGGQDVAGLAVPLALLALVLVTRACLGWGSDVVAQRISGSVKSTLRVALVEHAVQLGPRWAAARSSTEVTLLATRGLDALDAYFGRYLPQVALAAIVPVVVVACLFAVDVVAALTVALTVPLIPVFMVLIGRMSTAHRARRWRSLALLAHRFGDVVAGLPTLRAYGRADAQVTIVRGITERYRTTTLATLRVAFLSALVLELLATISVALIAVGVGLRLVEGSMTFWAGLFALVLAPEAYLPLRRLGAEFHASEEGLTAAASAFAIIDAPIRSGADGLEVPPALAAIAVEGVSVAQHGREILAPAVASLLARRGEVVAVTGPSGAGKSTLLAVVLGMMDPDEGRVSVLDGDGRATDVRALAPDAWRRAVAWVPQAPFLLAGSVADNVRFGASGIAEGEIVAALASVGLADVDPARRLGERGAGMSSGQRRRIGIARALVRRTPVLLLDEPTAGLDAAAEDAVLAAVRAEADRGAIVLLVAHRPGAIAGADREIAVTWASIDAAPGDLQAPVTTLPTGVA
jgi:thiol reductant ABC exporter CydD subunit